MSLIIVIKLLILGQFIHIKMLEGLKFQYSSSYLITDAYASVNKGSDCYIAVSCLIIFAKSVNPQTVFTSASGSRIFFSSFLHIVI